MAIDWGFEIAFFLVFTVIFLLVAFFWEQAKEKKADVGRAKCQCGYEYEGKALPQRCPQCGKPLYTNES